MNIIEEFYYGNVVPNEKHAPYEKDGTKLSSREYRTAVQGQSWKIKLMCDIDKAMEFSGSKEEFIQAMSVMGYSVIWTDDRKYITYQCPNRMKCRDIKLHEDKYLKGNIENEFRYRQEKYYRKSKTEEQQLTDFNRASVRRNESDCDSLPGQRGRVQFIENGSEVSTRAVQYDFKNFNRRPDGGISGENSGNQQRQFENNLTELSDRVEESFGTDSERSQIYTDSDYKNFRTGWEESRAVFERHLAERAGTLNANIITDKNSELYDIPEMVTHNSGIFNGINSLAESFSRIIVDDSEDEEERRKRIEAEQNGSALGTAIGFVAGVIVIKCGDCDSSFVCKTRNWRDFPERIEYVCNGYHRYGKENCSPHRINEILLDELIYKEILAVKDSAIENYNSIEADVKKWMKQKNNVGNKLQKLNNELEQRKKDQKDILLERIRDKEHAEIYSEMLEACEKDIQNITQEIESIKDYNTTIKKRKSEIKKTVDLIEEIVKDGAISNANLRLLVDEIKIYESDKRLKIEINLKANFTKHFEIYGESGENHNLILQDLRK